jgi:hypothetical protein
MVGFCRSMSCLGNEWPALAECRPLLTLLRLGMLVFVLGALCLRVFPVDAREKIRPRIK